MLFYMSFFSEPIHHLYSKLIKNNFKSLFEINADYPAGYLDWDFNSYPSSYEKYRKFLAYSEPYTKDYIFRILYKEIDLTSQFDNEFIDSTTDCNIKDYSLGDRIQLDESDWIKIKD